MFTNLSQLICSKDKCENKQLALGYCRKHYYQSRSSVIKGRRRFNGIKKINISGYQSWRGMKDRVSNPNVKYYWRYGGRGINACDAVFNSFDYFYKLMGERPKGMTLDRKDNDMGYWCGLCNECKQKNHPFNMRWATYLQQALNRTSKSSSGYKGIYFNEIYGTYKVHCNYKGKTKYVGSFKTLNDAVEARKQAELIYYGEKAS